MSGNRPQLAIVVYDFSATGVVRNAIRIAGHAAAVGMGTEFWVVRNEGPFKAQVPADVAVVPIGSGAAGARHGLRRGLLNLMAIRRIADAIAARRPQVLFSAGNHFHFATGLAYRYAGRPPGIRFIGRASNATPRLGRQRTLLGALANRADAMKYREMHRIVAVSRELAEDLTSRLHLPAERISVIPNGVDIAQVERQAAEPLEDPWFAPDAPPVIVSAGRLSRQKNYGLLIDAFAWLRRQRPARLIILGDGSLGARESLMSQAARLRVSEDVRLPGYEPNPMRYFARAQLFVLSSLWEGASNVLLEALACGCPVVATDCPTGVREQLEDGRIGEIVPLDDSTALARAMAERLAAPRDEEALRRHARHFDLAGALESYLQLIGGRLALAGSAAS